MNWKASLLFTTHDMSIIFVSWLPIGVVFFDKMSILLKSIIKHFGHDLQI